jgi:hypothetical protein
MAADREAQYFPILAAPENIADHRFWSQNEYQRIAQAFDAVFDCLDTLVDGNGGVLAYGSLHAVALGPILAFSNLTSFKVHMDTKNVAVPINILYLLSSDGMKACFAGVYQVDLYVEFDHDSQPAARVFEYGLYDEVLMQYITPTIAGVTNPSETYSESSCSLIIDIPEASVGNLLSLRLGGGASGTYAAVQVERAGFSLTRIEAVNEKDVEQEENAYDEYLAGLNPRLWIKGYKGVVNDGSAGAITVTTYQVGVAAFDVVKPAPGFTGAGANIDPNGQDGVRELISFDPGDWTLFQVGTDMTTELSSPIPGAIRIDGATSGDLSSHEVIYQLPNIDGRYNYGYNWDMGIDSGYTAGGISVQSRLRFIGSGGTVYDSTSTLHTALPVSGTGTNNSSHFSWEVFIHLNPDYDNVNTARTHNQCSLSLRGHGASVWEWPEETWVNNSDYTFGIIINYASTRFGLTTDQIQSLYRGGQAVGAQGVVVRFDNGNLKVQHDGTIHDFGAAPSGHIVITYDATALQLKLYVDGVDTATINSVAAPTGPASGWTEYVGAYASTRNNFHPIVTEFQHLWHVDSKITPAQAAALFAAAA